MLRYDHSSKEAAVKVYVVSHYSEWDHVHTLDRVFADEQRAKQCCKENGSGYFYDIMDLE
jgi:hypothetical protein